MQTRQERLMAVGDQDLPPLHFVAYEVPDCAICMEKMTDGLALLSCGHVYHQRCIEPLLHHRTGGNCPCCRADLRSRDCIKMILNIPSKIVDFTKHLGLLSGLGRDHVTQNAQILERAAAIQDKLDAAKHEIDEQEKELKQTKEELGIQQHKATVLKDKFIQLTTIKEQLQAQVNTITKQLADSQATTCQALEELILKQEKLKQYECIIKNSMGDATIDFTEELRLIGQLTQTNDVQGLSKRAKDLLCQCIKQEGRMEANEKIYKELEKKHQGLKDRFRRLLDISKEKPSLEESRRSTFTTRDSGQQEQRGEGATGPANSPPNQPLQQTSNTNTAIGALRTTIVKPQQPPQAETHPKLALRAFRPSVFDPAPRPSK